MKTLAILTLLALIGLILFIRKGFRNVHELHTGFDSNVCIDEHSPEAYDIQVLEREARRRQFKDYNTDEPVTGFLDKEVEPKHE